MSIVCAMVPGGPGALIGQSAQAKVLAVMFRENSTTHSCEG